ncbi:amiloride-sensitive sodium channel subunit gamma-like [Pelobates fuscus]|uniref:amiloride-sensitive sodium channel subunit gamma-like n=1 Tax=Pelobates fuscus TaxID=191477 RepID=UPI002FE4E472
MTFQQKSSLRTICSRTLRHTSAHGVPNIIYSKGRWRSCCWSAFVLLVLGCMIWQCSQLTATYLLYPTQEKVTLVNSARLPFPAITFCNLNRARRSQLNSSKYQPLTDHLSLLSMGDKEEGPTNTARERYFAFFLSQLSSEEQMELGHQLHDMLISCVFHDEVCDESFFTPFLNPKLGSCYTFNGPRHTGLQSKVQEAEVLNATKAGFSYGLTMELYIEQSEYISSLSTAAGLRVVLHGQGKMPFPEDEGVNVPPGQESDIGVVKVHVKRLTEPYSSRCSSGESIRNYYADVYGTDYSREACKKSCAQAKMIKNCGCRMWEFPAPPGSDVPLCNISEPSVNDCVEMYEYKLSHDQLRCHCPLQCEEEIFELTLSSSQWPSSMYLDTFSKHLSSRRGYQQHTENIRDNVVKVVVYYQQLNYELIEEVPSMQLVDLFSSIGGLVGLWIGVSVCTVAEFFELILNLLTFFIRQIPKRDEESPTNPYTVPDPDPCSPGLQSDNCFAWDDDGSNLLGDQYNLIQGIHNPYECYNT